MHSLKLLLLRSCAAALLPVGACRCHACCHALQTGQAYKIRWSNIVHGQDFPGVARAGMGTPAQDMSMTKRMPDLEAGDVAGSAAEVNQPSNRPPCSYGAQPWLFAPWRHSTHQHG